MDWIVEKSEEGQKLIAFLRQKLGSSYSARFIKQGIENNLCLVNGRLEHFASTILVKGDLVAFAMEAIPLEKQIKNSPKEDIIYQDEHLLVYNKPAGIASDSKELALQFKGWDLLHRLDKDTTGLLMFTKGEEFRKSMIELFKKYKVLKTYLAIVDGVPKESFGRIENYLKKLHSYEGQSLFGSTKNANEGQLAITDWKLEKKGALASLIQCIPRTGRTHQLRVHLSELNHPILGDKQYGRKIKCKYLAKRCLLHAYKLKFIHPLTGKEVQFIAPLPQDFIRAKTELIEK